MPLSWIDLANMVYTGEIIYSTDTPNDDSWYALSRLAANSTPDTIKLIKAPKIKPKATK